VSTNQLDMTQTTWWSVLGEEEQKALLELSQLIKDVTDAKRALELEPTELVPLFEAIDRLEDFYKVPR
jgi:hypothetical protein